MAFATLQKLDFSTYPKKTPPKPVDNHQTPWPTAFWCDCKSAFLTRSVKRKALLPCKLLLKDCRLRMWCSIEVVDVAGEVKIPWLKWYVNKSWWGNIRYVNSTSKRSHVYQNLTYQQNNYSSSTEYYSNIKYLTWSLMLPCSLHVILLVTPEEPTQSQFLPILKGNA